MESTPDEMLRLMFDVPKLFEKVRFLHCAELLSMITECTCIKTLFVEVGKLVADTQLVPL